MDKLTIGKRIKYERTKEAMTLDELGNHLGVSKQCLSGWEHGRNMPDVISLYKLSKIFHISIEGFLFDSTSENGKYPDVESMTETDTGVVFFTETEKKFIYKLRSMPPERRKALELLMGIKNN